MTQLVRKTDDEAGALVRLGFDELRGFTESVGTMERDIAARTFRFVPAGKPIQLVHDTIARGVVGALGGAAGAAGRGAQALTGRRPRPERPLSATPRGGLGIAVLNGLVGDRLERDGSPLAQPMAVRVDGLPVAPQRAELAEAFPAATPRLVVFLHGLMESERGWRLGAREGREDYGTQLARDLGVTPVYVRYNSGRHISENGRSLAELLEAVVDAWPVEVEEVALVGHSMGGLVARSACHIAALDGARWVGHVRKVVSLGSPHMGAPLEQAVHYAAFGLSRLPETRMIGSVPAPPQRRHPRPAPGLAGRRRLARARPRGAARQRLPGGAAARGRDALLRLRHRDPQPAPPAGPDGRRHARARAERVGRVAHPQARLRGRVRAARRRHAPHRAAQPPRGVREACGVAALADYPHVLDIPTRWKDNDVYGHVNNVEYYSYFDTVINRWLITEGGLDIHAGAVIGLCVESHCAFKAAVSFPDTIRAGLKVAHLGRSSVRYEIGLFREDDPEPAAEGWFVHVFVDREDRRPRDVPESVRNGARAAAVRRENRSCHPVAP